MARIILITGGARSGKSTFAQKLAEGFPGPRVYIATASRVDEEMKTRIREHQRTRAASGWQTIEEPLELRQVLDQAQPNVVLIDCLTLWINNLMYAAEQKGRVLGEQTIADQCRMITEVCQAHPGTFIFVTNEVGLGIVPDNALARQYRDLIGRCNQIFAETADTVVFMTCGIPLAIKGSLS